MILYLYIHTSWLIVLQVTFAYMKHLWQVGQRKVAFDTLSKFVRTQSKSVYLDPEDCDGDKLLARYAYVLARYALCISVICNSV